jgi:uncharacterized HAD superfamily protein
MKTIVVDVDETLFKSRKICFFLRAIAKMLFKLSLFLQKPNTRLIKKLNEYDTIIVLTARGENYRKFTERQLKKHGVKYDKLIMYNYSDSIFSWKSKTVAAIFPDEWIDDVKDRYVGIEGY